MGYQLTPNDSALDPLLGAMLDISAIGPVEDELFLAGEAGFSLGYDTKNNMPIDLRLAFGPGLHLGPVVLMPMVGVGADAYGGAKNVAYHMRAAAYYYGKVALRLAGLGPVAVSLSAARLMRGSMEGKANSQSAAETRLGAHVSIDRYALGVRATQHDNALLLGLIAGLYFGED
ncbi:MAG: hypothetical protein JW940_17555 [Polyangiaceae bacterium]|nr:hypothetical protein [Polyangiaceae bacterium]